MKVTITVSDEGQGVRVDITPSFKTLQNRLRTVGPEQMSPAEIYAILMLKKAREASEATNDARRLLI